MITRIIQSQEQLANNVTVEINIEEYVVWVSGDSYNEETKGNLSLVMPVWHLMVKFSM